MTTDELQNRIVILETYIEKLETENRQRSLDAAYLYIHSNWNLIRWYLTRERDVSTPGTAVFDRSKGAEGDIRSKLPPNLRLVQFSDFPMQIAYNWRIETTVILNRYGFTFFD